MSNNKIMNMGSRFEFGKILPKRVSTQPAQTHRLSSEQLKFYNENGYLVIKGLIDFTTLYACKQRFIDIAKQRVDKGMINVIKEPGLQEKGFTGEDLINKLQEIAYDDVFATYIENPVLLDVVSQIVGNDLIAIHSMFINKPPGSSRHPPHQDLYYFPFRPASKIVAAWTAVDPVTIDNGCLWVIPKSHLMKEMYFHDNLPGTNKMYHGIVTEATVAPEQSRVHVEMSPGDTIFFHPLIVHGSGPNTTNRYRKSVTVHYIDSSCDIIKSVGPQQELIAKEMEAEAKRRGFPISFTDAWLVKSKRVRGVRSHL